MKRLTLIAVLSLSMLSLNAHGHWFRGNSCATSCVAPVVCDSTGYSEVPPICTKTVMENKVIQVPKTVRVPARRIEIPQPDIIEHIPQAPRKICIKQPPIPQPDIIKYECVPDKVVCKPQPNIVRYECPVGTNENNPCGNICETTPLCR